MLIAAMATALLSGCYGKGSSADPPANFTPTAGDGRVLLTWTPVPGVDYWIFAAASPSLTAFNWEGLRYSLAYINTPTPWYMCGLFDDVQYYFASNGRINGGPGGPSSPTVTAMPYNASASAHWNAGSVSPATDLYGVGYTSLTTCNNLVTTSSSGIFAAVGTGGAIFTGTLAGPPYSIAWAPQSAPNGFTANLYAVTGYAAYQNNVLNPGLRWVAVGAGGASVYSTDGITWSAGGASGMPTKDLYSITQVGGNFYAVGDAGTIISTTDGITWTIHNSPAVSTSKLYGVTHGNYYVAVGESGTILRSIDGNTWSVMTPSSPISSTLRQVAYFGGIYGSIYVAVGDAGTIVTSIDGGSTWITQTALSGLPIPPNLVGITVETRTVDPAITSADPSLGVISTAQFVAIDSAGNAYTSVNGYTWTQTINTGISCVTATSCMNPLVSSGFGYVAAGDGGTTAFAF
ncbi:MAG TPA: hypothetical protein VMJ33_12140 [Gallionella sp.]|nr:hypothetical protein [Gallionella sp.]